MGATDSGARGLILRGWDRERSSKYELCLLKHAPKPTLIPHMLCSHPSAHPQSLCELPFILAHGVQSLLPKDTASPQAWSQQARRRGKKFTSQRQRNHAPGITGADGGHGGSQQEGLLGESGVKPGLDVPWDPTGQKFGWG